MNLGTIAGKLLFVVGGLFLCVFLYGMNSYAETANQYLYASAAFSSFVFGVICNELGKCADALEKTEKASYSSLKLHQDILSEIRNFYSRQDIKEVQRPQEEKKCSKCGKSIANDTTTCMHCGESVKWGW